MRFIGFQFCRILVFLLLVISGQARMRNPLFASSQLVIVTTSGWNAVDGKLQRYERAASGKWQAVEEPISVVVGKNGLGWGEGIVAIDALQARGSNDPVKKEGDGKAPAGLFQLSRAFGYAPEKLAGWKMSYIELTDSVECVDDSASKFYNRIVDRGSVTPDWNSSEHMRRNDELYRWGVVVDHNSNPPRAGKGSCIFLHIWRGPGQGTVGCTAMPREQLESLLAWLDPTKAPLLVQMPAGEYERVKRKLDLP